MRYEITVEIERPVEDVWAFMSETFNMPRLRGQSLTFRQTSPGPVGVGTSYEGRAMVLGFETLVTGSIIEWDPPHATAAVVHARPLRSFTLRETFEPSAVGTRLTRSFDLELRLPLKIIWPVIGPLVVRRWRDATRNIKVLMESEESSDAPAESGPPETRTDGTRTRRALLFTDIVDSTSLIELIGDDAWRDLRRWHDATLRGLFARHGGREVDHAGDGFFVTFGDTADAMRCAVEVQRTLAEHRRSAGFAPPVRIGVHSGDVTPDGPAYAGSAVHVAARIAAAAGGGQILASEASAREASITPGSPAELRELKGLADPVSIVVIPW